MFTLAEGDLYKVNVKYLEHLVQEKYSVPNFSINISSPVFVELSTSVDTDATDKLFKSNKCTGSTVGLILNLMLVDGHIIGSYIYVTK